MDICPVKAAIIKDYDGCDQVAKTQVRRRRRHSSIWKRAVVFMQMAALLLVGAAAILVTEGSYGPLRPLWLVLTGLLALPLVVGVSSAAKRLLRGGVGAHDLVSLHRTPLVASFFSPMELSDAEKAVVYFLRRRGYRPSHGVRGEVVRFFGTKGRQVPLGNLLLHLGLLLLLLAGSYSSLARVEGVIHVPAGESFDLHQVKGLDALPRDFAISVDRLWVEYYGQEPPASRFAMERNARFNGMVRDYKALVRLTGDAGPAEGVITASKPLTYQGVTIGYGGYGMAGVVKVKLPGRPEYYDWFPVRIHGSALYGWYNPQELKHLAFSFRLVPDLASPAGEGGGLPDPSKVNQRLIYTTYEYREGGWAIVEERSVPTIPAEISYGHGPYILRFTFVDINRVAGLRITWDPSVPLALFGAGLLLAGLALSMFFNYRKVLIELVACEGGTLRVNFRGSCDKPIPYFESEFMKLAQRLRVRLSGGGPRGGAQGV